MPGYPPLVPGSGMDPYGHWESMHLNPERWATDYDSMPRVGPALWGLIRRTAGNAMRRMGIGPSTPPAPSNETTPVADVQPAESEPAPAPLAPGDEWLAGQFGREVAALAGVDGFFDAVELDTQGR